MPRPYSDKFLLALQEEPEEPSLGIELGRLCIAAKLPATYVAVALETTRMTVYSWFRGQEIRKQRRKNVRVFMDLIKGDLERNILPVASNKEAKVYIENLAGVRI
ncbi:MAG: hypothetical protein ACK559_03295 [bacterium]|jgi:hypothetical protein